MELLKQEASECGPGCGCHTVGPSSRNRWVVGVIALVAAVLALKRFEKRMIFYL
jgi:MYXO-CTERM domain-containing protein